MNLLESFEKTGICDLGRGIDPKKCEQLLLDIKQAHRLGPEIFLTEAQYHADLAPIQNNTTKITSHFLDKFDLSFIEKNDSLKKILTEVLGEDYRIYAKRVIVGVPQEWIPQWAIEEIQIKHPPKS